MAWTSPRTWSTGEVVTAAHMNAHVRDNLAAGFPDTTTSTSWTPVLEGTTKSEYAGTTTGRRWRVGPLQFVWARFTGMGLGEVEGVFFVTLPVAASGLTVGTVNGQMLGTAYLVDNSAASNRELASVVLATSNTVRFNRQNGSNVTHTAPFTWETADALSFQAVYTVA